MWTSHGWPSMTDRPDAQRAPSGEDPAVIEATPVECGLCGAASLPARWRASGLCPACGGWDPDAAFNRSLLQAWIERTRRAAREPDDATGHQKGEHDHARC
jgi:hypothetical protein